MRVKIKVKPGSGKQKIEKAEEGYVVWLKERAEDNKANIELLKLMKKYLGKNIKIIKGVRSRDKIIEVRD